MSSIEYDYLFSFLIEINKHTDLLFTFVEVTAPDDGDGWIGDICSGPFVGIIGWWGWFVLSSSLRFFGLPIAANAVSLASFWRCSSTWACCIW